MKNYKYNFDPSSKKYQCPACRQKRFVRYVNFETGEFLPDRFGKCDRSDKCRYWLKPDQEYSDYELPEPLPEKQIDQLPLSLVEATGKEFKNNKFVQSLRSVAEDNKVKQAIKRFLIGTSKYWDGAVVFWYVDEANRVRNGKIMLYDEVTGKRVKNNNRAYITYVRAALKRYDLNLKQCLFGLHQIQEEEKPIAIVESEKTAVKVSMFNDSFTWMATGSKATFNQRHLDPIRNKLIVAFPDKGCYADWCERAERLNAIGYKITVDRQLEDSDMEDGSDIADLLVVNNFKELTPLERFFAKNTSIELLCKTFDLDTEKYKIQPL